jgi:hypothetical protein
MVSRYLNRALERQSRVLNCRRPRRSLCGAAEVTETRMRVMIRRAVGVSTLAVSLGATGCGGDDAQAGATGGASSSNESPDVSAGSTVIVAVVNPVVNDAHNTGVPASLGNERNGITVDAEPGGSDVTEDGIAVVDVPTGAIALAVGSASLSHTVHAKGDVYDAPIALDGANAAFFAATPIRYPVGKDSGAVFFEPDAPLTDIEARLAEDDRVVVLRPGIYKGSLTITGKGVLLFGEDWTDRAVVVDGSITANGEEVRLRGLTITGNLAAKGNNFGISFSAVKGATSITGNAGAFVRNVFCGMTAVPSSSVTLLDNHGIEPSKVPPAGACD